MRLIRRVSQPTLAVRLVILIVPLEPDDLAVALEGEHVRRNAIEKPAVVADDHGAAGEIQQRLLERAERVDVEIVGRLVEQQQVAALLQELGEMDAVAFAARQRADLALLRGALEIEPRNIRARRDLFPAEFDLVEPAGNLFPDRLVRVERLPGSDRRVRPARCRRSSRIPASGCFLARQHPKQRRLAGAVRSNHADDPAARQREVEALDQQVVAVALLQPVAPRRRRRQAADLARCRFPPSRSSGRCPASEDLRRR